MLCVGWCGSYDLISGCCVFFFKQKTAYEMRISDWSSDVCSSDLMVRCARRERALMDPGLDRFEVGRGKDAVELGDRAAAVEAVPGIDEPVMLAEIGRSEERRVGKECVSTCRSRWSPYH